LLVTVNLWLCHEFPPKQFQGSTVVTEIGRKPEDINQKKPVQLSPSGVFIELIER
jgi:hypothetical protein